MKYSRKRFAEALVNMLETHSLQDVVRVAAHEIIAQKRTRDVDLVLQDISYTLLANKKHLEIAVASAHPLTAAIKKTVTQLLQNHFGATTAAVSATVDPSLIGGLIARTPGGALDLSVHSQLKALTH